MKEFKGTKGEWYLEGETNSVATDLDVVGNEICYPPEWEHSLKKWEANAKLIVSAPQLLEVIQECDEYLKGNNKNYIGNGSILHRKLEQAISKAL